jgi:hypothetical protein
MLPFTLALWQFLPQLRFVQFPWRWLLCLNAPFALLLAMGTRRWISRVVICAGLVLVLVMVWNKVQPPWWDRSGDIAELRDNLEEGTGYEGVNEYVPAGANIRALRKDMPEVVVEGDDDARVEMDEWSPESKSFSVTAARPARVAVRLLRYPAWKVYLNDRPVAASPQHGGVAAILVPAGKSDVQIVFLRTPDRKLGIGVSLMAAVIVGVLAAWRSWRASWRRQST